MIEHESFTPDWTSPPGETIEDLLEEQGWTQAELAERTGFTTKHVNDLVKGRAAITPDTASRLSSALGSPVRFWLTREAHYRAALERRRTLKALAKDADWLRELPVAWMTKQRWIRELRGRAEKVQECLRYFGVASVEAWRETYARPLTAFRASSKFERKLGAVAVWLRQAEREATEIECAPFDKPAFRSALSELRSLTLEADLEVLIPRLQEACAACGVAVVFVPAPPGCPVHGATKWLTPEKALLGLTLRYRTNDHLWFSFFHEAAHIVRHSKKLEFIEGLDGLDGEHEAEADRYARDLLIPPAEAKQIASLRGRAQVLAFAERIGVAPGVVVGRMQREGLLAWSRLNGLKVRYEYEWGEEELGVRSECQA